MVYKGVSVSLRRSQTTDRLLTSVLLTSAQHESGLKISAGKRTMSGQDNHLSGQTFCSPVIETQPVNK